MASVPGHLPDGGPERAGDLPWCAQQADGGPLAVTHLGAYPGARQAPTPLGRTAETTSTAHQG